MSGHYHGLSSGYTRTNGRERDSGTGSGQKQANRRSLQADKRERGLGFSSGQNQVKSRHWRSHQSHSVREGALYNVSSQAVQRRRRTWDKRDSRQPPLRTRSPCRRERRERYRSDRRDNRDHRQTSYRDDDIDDLDDDESTSSDDETPRGQFEGKPGLFLDGRYEYLNDLGKGTFGKVIQAYNHATKKTYAIKVVRAVKRYLRSARIEGDMLEQIKEVRDRSRFDSDGLRCVSMYNRFQFQGHECLVFERLGPSLLDEQERIKYKPFRMEIIRHVGRQLLQALRFLHDRVQMVHTDVKMENVLFVQPTVADCSQPISPGHSVYDFDVKLIDFGGATFHSSQNDGTINTRQYRAPEVILQLGWDYPSDIWGAGALLMELFLGDLLFQSDSVEEHLALIERVRGHRFPESMRHAAASRSGETYFDKRGRVIWPRDAESLANIRGTRSLNELIFETRSDVNPSELNKFFHVMWGMLDPDPKMRMTAHEALRCDFFQS